MHVDPADPPPESMFHQDKVFTPPQKGPSELDTVNTGRTHGRDIGLLWLARHSVKVPGIQAEQGGRSEAFLQAGGQINREEFRVKC